MNAKKKNPKPDGKTRRKKSEPEVILRSEDTSRRNLKHPTQEQITTIRETQEQLRRQMQAAGTAPSDEVERETDSLYESARALLHVIEQQIHGVDVNAFDAENRFCEFARWVIGELCSLSKRGHYEPLRSVWLGGRLLAETIHDEALHDPFDSQSKLFGLPDLQKFASTLPQRSDPVSKYLWGRLTPATQNALTNCQTSSDHQGLPIPGVEKEFKQIIRGQSIYDEQMFINVLKSGETLRLLKNKQKGKNDRLLNISLLEDAYPEIPWYPLLGNLRRVARNALFMPSLRANTKFFEHDFKEVAGKIQLSENHTLRVDPKAEYQLDRSATLFVVKMIDQFTFLSETLAEKKAEFLQFKNKPQAPPDLKGTLTLTLFQSLELTLENWLEWHCGKGMASELLLCEGIKPLNKDTAVKTTGPNARIRPVVGSARHSVA